MSTSPTTPGRRFTTRTHRIVTAALIASMLTLGVLSQIDTTRQVLWQTLLILDLATIGVFLIANRRPKKTNP